MRKYLKQNVPYNEHPSVNAVESLNWENIRVFLAVERHGTFRGAAKELGMALNTVRRHVELLERETSRPLVTRNVKGITLTPEGRQFFTAAKQMERASFDVKRIARSDIADSTGQVQISVTEGVGTFWVVPQLVKFQRSQPKIIVELNCTMRQPDLLRMEADIAIQLVRPINPDLKLVKLGRMHVMPFASKEYLNLYGRPNSLAEVVHHRIVEQLSPQIDVDAVDRLFPDTPREGFVAVATNTSTAHYRAVEEGAGLGMLPTYLVGLGAPIEPVDLDLHVQHEIWMAYHPEAKKLKRVAITIDWLRQAFRPQRFPWFRDEFIHPRDFDDPAQEDLTQEDPNTDAVRQLAGL